MRLYIAILPFVETINRQSMETIKTELAINTNLQNKLSEIDHLNFYLLKVKLSNYEDGEGWTREQCDMAEFYYKRFLKLILYFPQEKLVPNKTIDTFWHYHILDTKHYISATNRIFGEYIHHYPYLGLLGENDKQKLNDSFERTLNLYYSVFNESLPPDSFGKCDSGGGGGSTCAGRCNKS